MDQSPGTSQQEEGDDVSAETKIQVRQFVAARVAEISSLTAQLSTGGGVQGRGKGFSFQHVSKHMRRRAVSHNPKRLPSRLRASHLAQLRKSSGRVVKKPKRPRKHYRKRSDGDILEYNRRQLVNPKWLESHIWHAKRFHMKLIWDRKIANAPTAKCFRSLYRAARNSVIMQDVSYLDVVEVSGPLAILTQHMKSVISNGFASTPLWNRELTGYFISSETSTYMGTIKYMWVETKDKGQGKILIWMHPATKSAICEELQRKFNLEEEKVDADFPEFPNKDEKKHLWKIVNNPQWSNTSSSVIMKDLSGCFNRIRLVGPKTLSVLKDLLKLGRFTRDHDANSEKVASVLREQEAVWESVKKLVLVPNDTVIPLNVIDPRRELPTKRQRIKMVKNKETDANDDNLFHSRWPEFKTDSPLWSDDVRRWVLRNRTSDDQLSRARSKNLIPGTKLANEPDVIPIVLVIRSRGKNLPGVDLILPCGWLMSFWIALSYRCVRSYAMEFNDYLTFEENPYLLDFYTSRLFPPDSTAYSPEAHKSDKELRSKYFSYPPAKRQNLIKLGCAFPFSNDWRSFLAFLSKEEKQSKPQVIRKDEDLQAIRKFARGQNHDDSIFENDNLLLPVTVILFSGAVERGACICLPTAQDLELRSKGTHNDVHIVQQPFKDRNEGKRAELSRQHHKRLSHLRKKRKVARRAALGFKKEFDLDSRLQELDSKLDVKNYNENMNNLWLNSNPHEVLSQQDREIIGFAEYAHFSFVRGKSAAMGCVVLSQLKKLVELQNTITGKKGSKVLTVLVRNWASSLTYHWAKLEVAG